MNKWIKMSGIIVACLLVLGAFVYVGTNEFNKFVSSKQTVAYNQGGNDAVLQVLSAVSKCQPVPFTVQNVTITLTAQECLKK